MDNQSIYLIGLMAVGKSTVGRLLADKLKRPFFDTDKEVEKKAGAAVSWIFDVEGEEGFRDREEQVIEELTGKMGIIVATGGGVIKRKINRRMISENGIVLHLDCPNKTLINRVKNDKKRPLLEGRDVESVLLRLKSERDPLYGEIANYRFVTDEQSNSTLVKNIIDTIGKHKVI